MKRFKKRTLALVLASVVTVVGAFAANNYKNSLMGLSFEMSSGNNIKLVVQTKAPYEGNVTPMRKDAGTYVLILPEVNSEAATPDLQSVSANISSVSIGTMPYSNNAKGYTRITIKTNNPATILSATNQVFVGTSQQKKAYIPQQTNNYAKPLSVNPTPSTKKSVEQRVQTKVKTSSDDTTENGAEDRIQVKVQQSVPSQQYSVSQQGVEQPKSSDNNIYLYLWAILIVLSSALFYTRAKNRMQELSGEEIKIDTGENPPKETKFKKLTKIQNAVNILDSAYSATTKPENAGYTIKNNTTQISQSDEELNIVDLDELFQEHKTKSDSKEDEENQALEDFLSGFSFDDESSNLGDTDEKMFDEETYEKIINNSNIVFTKKDVERIKKLLGTEINDETKKNIEEYVVSEPSTNKLSKQKILEELVTDYTISQKIIFTREDINTLNQLITLELDSDFITDLRTNPEKTIEMEKEILSYREKPKKPSEIVTLNVGNALPDLSEELKKYSGKNIESNYKAEPVYYNEICEVATLTVGTSLPDLSIEINKEGAFDSKGPEQINYIDKSYVVGAGELKVSSELPDLQDILANPAKYDEPEEEVVVDEEALLKNITNVQFKPFYDGTNEFEVLNDFSDIPSVDGIKEEFKQFENFEIAEDETINQVSDNYESQVVKDNPIITSENPNNYQNLSQEENKQDKIENKQNDLFKESEQKIKTSQTKKMRVSTEELIRQIEAARAQREIRKARIPQQNQTNNKNTGSNIPVPQKEEVVRCILNGEVYSVVSSAVLEDNKGCYLAKNDSGYAILGYVGDKLVKIKQYDDLKSEKIHARFSEKLEDGTLRFIVRIGITKFILQVREDTITYIMDL